MRNIPIETLEYIALMLKTISHPIRIKIIDLLEHEDALSVNDICTKLDMKVEQSLLSHHLNKLKDKEILMSRKIGQQVFYSLKMKEVTTILDCMESCSNKH